MKFFEDILKNRLKDAVSREGVDADDLWADIAGALPAEETKRKYWGLWLLLPFLFVGGGLLCFALSENQNEIVSLNDATITVIGEEKMTIEQTEIKEGQAINTNANTVKSIENEVIEIANNTSVQAKMSQKKELINSTKNEKIVKIKEKTTINIESELAANSQYTFDQLSANAQNSANSLALEKFPSTELVEVRTQEDKTTLPPFKSTSLLASKIFFINQDEIEKDFTDLTLPINSLLKPSKKKKSFNIEIGAYSGINTVKNLFENSTKGELLQNAYKARLGYTIGTEIQLKLKNNLSFSTGLEYSKTMTQFNIVQEKDGFTDNPNTTIVDENEVRAKIVRTVRHHNRLDFLTVPLVVSTRKEFGKLNLGIGAGLAWNLVLNQEGKTLNAQDEIEKYIRPALTLYSPPYNNFISYHLRPSLQFKASKNLSFQVRPELRYTSHGNSDFFGLKHSSLMTALNFGFHFKL